MIAIKTADLTQDFRKVADRVVQGEKVLVSRPRNENLVIITEKEYNELENLRKEHARRTLKDILSETREDAHINGISEMTMDEIDDLIAEVRKEVKREKK